MSNAIPIRMANDMDLSIDGLTTKHYARDEVVNVPPGLAQILINSKRAEAVNQSAKGPAPENKALGATPENKSGTPPKK